MTTSTTDPEGVGPVAQAPPGIERILATPDEPALFGLIPGAFFHHMRAARREALLAVRTLLDAQIDAFGPEPGSPRPTTRRINIE